MLTRRVVFAGRLVLDGRMRAKISAVPLESMTPGTRLVARLRKTTTEPSALTTGASEVPLPPRWRHC
jgi:hypothetical protein